MARGLAWLAALLASAWGAGSATARDAPIQVQIGWSEFQPVISMRTTTAKLQVNYSPTQSRFLAEARPGTREIWVYVSYGPQGARPPDSYRFRLVPKETSVEFLVPRPPPLQGCDRRAQDRIGMRQQDWRTAFWMALEARELLRRPSTQRGFCGRVMRPRLTAAYEERLRDIANNYENISLPLFIE